jgi:hypothetical protein
MKHGTRDGPIDGGAEIAAWHSHGARAKHLNSRDAQWLILRLQTACPRWAVCDTRTGILADNNW